jgi:hypothetical protein
MNNRASSIVFYGSLFKGKEKRSWLRHDIIQSNRIAMKFNKGMKPLSLKNCRFKSAPPKITWIASSKHELITSKNEIVHSK